MGFIKAFKLIMEEESNMEKGKEYEELERERRKLNLLIDEALENGTPMSECKEIIEQSRKIDALIAKIQKAKDSKNQLER